MTCNTGASTIFTMSVQNTLERMSRGSEVVKPIWLLMMICTVPPVEYPRVCANAKVSWFTPWPPNAASPCTNTGSTCEPCGSARRSIRARTEPSTTGFTISRCDGLNANDKCTGPPAVLMSELKPWWYLTSPAGKSSGAVWSNSANKSAGNLRMVLTSTFSRPRCAMPITISCTPCALAL